MLSLRLKGRYTPHSTLSEDRVISLLFNVVIETQRQIYTPFNTIRGQSDLFTVQCCHWHSKADIPTWSTLSEDRVISSLFNVVIDTQSQIYPPVNTSRGQSDLFTVQCCHWHSKADIPPHSTLSEDRVISSLFNVVIDTQRQIYPPGQHYQSTEWSLHCSMLSLTFKGRYSLLSFKHQISLIARSSTMHIYIYRRQIVVKNGNFTFLLTSSGQLWQFHISTDI